MNSASMAHASAPRSRPAPASNRMTAAASTHPLFTVRSLLAIPASLPVTPRSSPTPMLPHNRLVIHIRAQVPSRVTGGRGLSPGFRWPRLQRLQRLQPPAHFVARRPCGPCAVVGLRYTSAPSFWNAPRAVARQQPVEVNPMLRREIDAQILGDGVAAVLDQRDIPASFSEGSSKRCLRQSKHGANRLKALSWPILRHGAGLHLPNRVQAMLDMTWASL